jgi:hypothetical protein
MVRVTVGLGLGLGLDPSPFERPPPQEFVGLSILL